MMNDRLRVGILETGRPPEELVAVHGSYPAMVRTWLGDMDATFSEYAVLDNEFPDSPSDADLWVITGSKFGAYEDHSWIPPLEHFIRDARDAGKLMFGICFGHQIIAQALGGVVRKSEKGWGLGVHKYTPSAEWPSTLGKPPQAFAIQAYHQDQVEEKPPGAVTLASNQFCEHGALWYPGFAVTVQGHPEFAKPYASALLQLRKGTVLRDDEVDEALRKMSIQSNRDLIADLVRTYLMKQAAAT